MSEGKLIFFTNDTYPHANLWMRSTGGHSFHVLVSFFFLVYYIFNTSLQKYFFYFKIKFFNPLFYIY